MKNTKNRTNQKNLCRRRLYWCNKVLPVPGIIYILASKRRLWQFSLLNHSWNNAHVITFSKYLVFMAIPMTYYSGDTNLRHSESHIWTGKMLSCTGLQIILKITITSVKKEKIRNKKARSLFYNIPDVSSHITTRQCRLIGTIVRGPEEHLPKQLFTARYDNYLLPDQPITTNIIVFVKSLRLLLPEEMGRNQNGNMSNWIDIKKAQSCGPTKL